MKRRSGIPREVGCASLAAVLSGCVLASGGGQATDASPVAPLVVGRGGSPTAESQGQGWLRVEVRWPRRDLPGFRAQAIPLRTRSIRLTTLDANATVADQRLLVRSAGSTLTSGATLLLEAGAGYSIKAEAFEEADPAVGAEPIAAGTAANVQIQKSKTTAVPITLTAAHAPAIQNLSVASGPYGLAIALTGTNFGWTKDLPFEVRFGGLLAAATRDSDTQIRTVVPLGAPSGNVTVTVDGITSSSVAMFQITEGLDASIVDRMDLPHGLDVDLQSTTTDQGIEVTLE